MWWPIIVSQNLVNEPPYQFYSIVLAPRLWQNFLMMFFVGSEMALLIEVETVKELFFGGAFGLCAGIAARYVVHSHQLQYTFDPQFLFRHSPTNRIFEIFEELTYVTSNLFIVIALVKKCFVFNRRFGVGMVGSISGILFVVFRSAIFDGTLLASWSPLAIDDASFTTHLVNIFKGSLVNEVTIKPFLRIFYKWSLIPVISCYPYLNNHSWFAIGAVILF